jgi:S-(hydroxymethyl)glutathione dehydrogenase / alcohol dehydrogenase
VRSVLDAGVAELGGRLDIVAANAAIISSPQPTWDIDVGGLGSAAVQGARLSGARHIFAIDPVEFKRSSALGFGATHASTDVVTASDLIREVTWGRMCDVVVLTMAPATRP